MSLFWNTGRPFQLSLHLRVLVYQLESIFRDFSVNIILSKAWFFLRHLSVLFNLRLFINLLVVSLFLLLVVPVKRISLAVLIGTTNLFRNGSDNAALLGYKAVFNNLAYVFSFLVLAILGQLIIFELTSRVFHYFSNVCLTRQKRTRDRSTQVLVAVSGVRSVVSSRSI